MKSRVMHNELALSREGMLKASEVRYRRLFETAQDGILILDLATGRIADANPFICGLLGYAYEQMVGLELWEIGLFSDIAANQAAFEELRANKYIRYEHMPLQSKDGRAVEVEFVSNVYDEGQHQVIQCNIRDITQRRILERQAQEQAEALADAQRRKDEFLAILSHELRNPLASMSSAVHLLRLQNAETSNQRQVRATLERQIGQLTRLVDDLLEVSRITTGRIRLRFELLKAGIAVQQAVETMRPKLEQRRQVLTLSLPQHPIWLFADPMRLEQVIVNLLSNAAKYTNIGGEIAVTVRQEKQVCLVMVSDTGSGIAPELLPHVFDLYTQSEGTVARSQGGLGIGLAVVQRLVELHHGTVEVRSAPGRGSEFMVRLPVSTAPEPETALAKVERSPPPSRQTRVLVVDDNVDVGTTFALVLQEEGYEARAVFDGPAALAAALESKPHVVLLDIGMPGWDGYEVARRIRDHPSLKSIQLVALTGYGQESDRTRSQEAGFVHHLVKPVDLDDVKRILAAASQTADG